MTNKLQQFLQFINQHYKTNIHTINAIRKKTKNSILVNKGKKKFIPLISNFTIKLTYRTVKIRLYHPTPFKNLPIMIYSHGGSFISGNLNIFDIHCRSLSQYTQHVVISIHYALIPERPYPYGLNDIYESSLWAYHHAININAVQTNFIMIGDSSGANYTVLCVNRAKKSGDFKIKQQVLIYPTTNLNHDTYSMQKFGYGFALEKNQLLWTKNKYKPKNLSTTDPSISPIHIKILRSMPNTVIITTGYDPLRDEGLLLNKSLINTEVAIKHFHFDNIIHGFINFASSIPHEMILLYKIINNCLHV